MPTVETVENLMVGLVLLGLAAGCSRSTTSSSEAPANLEAWVAEVDRRPPSPLPPLPQMRQSERFEYAAQALRDPFSRAFRAAGGSGSRPDSGRSRHKLEEFSLDSLDMAGTIRDDRALVGLVAAPDKVIYRVRPDDYLGQNDGRVTGVYPDRIELVEMVSDGAGGWLERSAAIVLDDQ